MGKADAEKNIPTNSSLSISLPYLFTRVEVEFLPDGGRQDRWEPLLGEDLIPISMGENGQQRFLRHFQFLKETWGVKDQGFVIRSANNFPSDCGIASSASSFAALTRAASLALQEFQLQGWTRDLRELSRLSRQGSGSSCRSFFEPWALWRKEWAEPVQLPQNQFWHVAILIDAEKKSISSSHAHALVRSSLLFAGRAERAERRLSEILTALQKQDWPTACAVAWDELWDMHALFLTSRPAFSFLKEQSLFWLNEVLSHWQIRQDGPLVTVDAGPNVHLFFRDDQKALCQNWLRGLRDKKISFISNCECDG
jgi:diphosphomevalonate decarboxylase